MYTQGANGRCQLEMCSVIRFDDLEKFHQLMCNICIRQSKITTVAMADM